MVTMLVVVWKARDGTDGGKLDIVAFDKTGTLTEDGLDVLQSIATKYQL